MKLDPKMIPGFAEMTAEQKVEAILGADLPYVTKEIFDRKASEAADYSRRLKAKQTEEENKEQERTDALAEMQKQLEEANSLVQSLKQEKLVGSLTADFLAQGYSKELAPKAAAAMAAGNHSEVMKLASQHLTEYTKSLKEELMKGTPTPPGASGSAEPENISAAKAFGASHAASTAGNGEALASYIMNK